MLQSRMADKQNVWFVSVTEKKAGINTVKEYGNPVFRKMTVSTGAGYPGQISAGLVVDYDREIVSYDMSLRKLVREGDAVFVDIEPEVDRDGNLVMSDDGVTPVTPPDYRVERIFSTKRGRIDVFGIKKIGGNR